MCPWLLHTQQYTVLHREYLVDSKHSLQVLTSSKHTHVQTCSCDLQGINPRQGLPTIRQEWVKKREQRGDKVVTQMHYAKKGVVTEEMAFCAARERLEPEFVRSEVSHTTCYH